MRRIVLRGVCVALLLANLVLYSANSGLVGQAQIAGRHNPAPLAQELNPAAMQVRPLTPGELDDKPVIGPAVPTPSVTQTPLGHAQAASDTAAPDAGTAMGASAASAPAASPSAAADADTRPAPAAAAPAPLASAGQVASPTPASAAPAPAPASVATAASAAAPAAALAPVAAPASVPGAASPRQ
jgi:hypothetical protein